VERLALADLVALARAVLDHDEAFGETPEARTPEASRDLAMLERARSVRKLLAALRQVSPEGLVPAPIADEVEELLDRADELVDTMLWATERRGLLLDVIGAETSRAENVPLIPCQGERGGLVGPSRGEDAPVLASGQVAFSPCSPGAARGCEGSLALCCGAGAPVVGGRWATGAIRRGLPSSE
jgi:hypothetical protein